MYSYAGFLCGLLLAACLTTRGTAHEYWLEPERARGGKVGIRLMLGAGFGQGEEKRTQKRRFASASLLTPHGQSDLLPELTEAARPLLSLETKRCGAGALISLERTPARITLDHVKFNAYLRQESLVQAILDRTRAREMGRAGRERYTRFLKLLLPAARDVRPVAPLSLRAVGHTLEVVPEVPLESLRRGQELPVRVRFESAPLPGVFVTLVRRPREGEPQRQTERTDADGRVKLRVEGPGWHALRLVHIRRVAADPTDFTQPEWESFWSSYVFRVSGR